MALEVVTGAPFSGKAPYVEAEIERREAAGELGLIALDWTRLYLSLFPGAQSALRDEAVSDTGRHARPGQRSISWWAPSSPASCPATS